MKFYKDYYFYQAKKLFYPARSFFKLKEIDEKYSFFKKKLAWNILDLGAAPGSWSLYLLNCFGKNWKGSLYLFDQEKINIDPYFTAYEKKIEKNIFFIQEDLKNLAKDKYQSFDKLFLQKPLDFILSDMAPKNTGQSFLNHCMSLELISLSLPIVNRYLKENGHFIFKTFDGEDLDSFLKTDLNPLFKKIKRFKPKACRKKTSELYVICFLKKKKAFI